MVLATLKFIKNQESAIILQDALKPIIDWIIGGRHGPANSLITDPFLMQFSTDHRNLAPILFVLKNSLIRSVGDISSPSLISYGCNQYIPELLSMSPEVGSGTWQGLRNLFLVILQMDGITEDHKSDIREKFPGIDVMPPPPGISGGKRKSKRKCKKSKRSRKRYK